MKNTYITIIVLIILIGGAVFFVGAGKKAQAPLSETSTGVDNGEDNNADNNNDIEISTTLSTASVKEFTVSGKNFSFTPSLITVKKGDKVKITFQNSAGFHDFVIDEYGVATKQTQAPTTEVLEFTADKVGSFEYYCSVGSHRQMGMKGILKVE